MNAETKLSRIFDYTRGSITITYDPESATEDCVYIDHSAPLFMSLDETHRFYSFFMDFLATARESYQRRPRQELPKDFRVSPIP